MMPEIYVPPLLRPNKKRMFIIDQYKGVEEKILITMDMSTPSTAGITLNFASGSLSIDWKEGGGKVPFVSGVELTHTYVVPGAYIAEITGDFDYITTFLADNNKITTINNLKTGLLTNFRIRQNLIVGSIDLSKAPVSNDFFTYDNSGHTEIILASSGNGTLDNVRMYNCNYSAIDFSNVNLRWQIFLFGNSSLNSLILPSSGNGAISAFHAYSCALPSIDFSVFPTSDGVSILLYSNGMPSTEVDNQLINLDGTGWINGTLNIAGTNAARTSASDTAYSNLISNGWAITVN